MNNKFISCDWGTSSFRLRLVEAAIGPGGSLRVVGELRSDQGIAGTFELWKNTGKGEEGRLAFYRSILEAGIADLEKLLNVALPGTPLVISGMASSSIGMKELPYKELPFSTDGMDLNFEILEATEDYKYRTLLISGARTTNDVMRGEETQLIGCVEPLLSTGGERIFIFPGTHSKHVRVKNGHAIDLKTYMTGEYFALLSKNSILSVSVAEAAGLPENIASFREGVRDSVQANLLHQSFLVRTNQLFGKKTKEENYSYLSGLLIGTECKELIDAGAPLTIVSEGVLRDHYTWALGELGFKEIEIQGLDQAVINGHAKIIRTIFPG